MPPVATARALIESLDLAPLPGEGGFFRATWHNETASAILFLMTRTEFSALHRLDRDELWYFHAGCPIELFLLDPHHGDARQTRMGPDVLSGDQPQVHVPAGVWQGARLDSHATSSADFTLLSCTVSPPWDDRCCTLGARDELIRAFPHHAALVRELTR